MPVRHLHLMDVLHFARQQFAHPLIARVVGAITPSDDERLRVEPEDVAAFERLITLQRTKNGNAQPRKLARQRWLLAPAQLLAHVANYRTRVGDEARIGDKDGVKQFRLR